jgi:hypothetical protein
MYRNKIQHHVPLVGETTFKAISTECGLSESDVTRFLRYGIARHIFQEPKKGVVAHTAASRLVVHNKLIESWLMNIAEEFWPSLSRTVDATIKWPGSQEPNESVLYNTFMFSNKSWTDLVSRDTHCHTTRTRFHSM